MVGCLALVLAFGSSSTSPRRTASPSPATMAITSCSSTSWPRDRWGSRSGAALLLVVPFLAFDLAFFGANAVKIADGGWFPLAIGAAGLHADDDLEARAREPRASSCETVTLADDLFLADVDAVAAAPRAAARRCS